MTNNLYRFFSLFIFIYESKKLIRRPEMADLIDPSEIMTNAIHPSLLQLPHNLVAAIQVK